MTKGWHKESKRHSLAAMGVETSSRVSLATNKLNAKLRVESESNSTPKSPDFYKYLWEQNEGVFFRGETERGSIGIGVLGKGVYVTWKEGMARVFAKISAMRHGGDPVVTKYKLPLDIKLLDWQSDEAWKIRKSLGAKTPEDKYGDSVFASVLTYEVQKKGYDGIISDDVADGIVIFDSSKVTEVK